MRRRKIVVLLSVLAGLALICGAGLAVNNWRARAERSRHDRLVRSYLKALTNGDYDTAYALVCTDETGIDADSFRQLEQEARVRSFQIDAAGDWSSWVDGHGREYRVRITRASGVEAVERIPTREANGECIEYGLIRDQ